MKKGIISLLIIFCFLPFLNTKADAASGKCGDNLTWTLDDTGTLTISGNGPMYDYCKDDWVSDLDNIEGTGPWGVSVKVAIIKNGATSIGDCAFNGCTGLTRVEISNSVTSIGSFAFSGCTRLIDITIPISVNSFYLPAFFKCERLKTAGPIGGNYNLKFGWTESIPSSAFHMSSLTKITIPSSITSIGGGAFAVCTGLTSITIPSSVTSIGWDVFSGCTGLVTAGPIGGNYNIQFGWTKSIPNNAFYGCTGLTSITIPSSVTSIGQDAFRECTGLTSITIPSSVTSIGATAFWGCRGLTSITIPSSVTSIISPFGECDGLKTAGPIGGNYNIQFGWTKSIPNFAFDNCTGLTSITIPSTVTSIGNYAFWECTGLTSITIPSSVTSIGNYAFWECTGLTSITIPSSVTSISKGAFRECTGLTSITIPSSVTSIGEYAFNGCTEIEDIFYGGSDVEWDNITICTGNEPLISDEIHYNTMILYLPMALTEIGDEAFRGGSYTYVRLSENTQKIGAYAFADCQNLSYIYIPAMEIYIDPNAFGYKQNLTILGKSGSTAEAYAKTHGYTFQEN